MPSFRTNLPPSGRGLRALDSYNQDASAIEGRDQGTASSSSSGSSSPLVGHGANAQAGSSTKVLDIFLPPPSTPPRSKKHHGRRQEPGHVPRPMNAFFVFRSKFNKDNRGSGKRQQNEMSKMAATAWKALTKAEKRPYEKESDRQKAEHYEAHPDYQYSPKRSHSASKVKAAKAAVARASRKASVASTSAATSRSASVRSARATPLVSSAASSSSNVAYSPELLFPRAVRAPRHAAQNAVQCYEWMASLSSPRIPGPSPASSMTSSYPPSSYPSSPRILPYSQFPPLSQPAVDPTANVPIIALDPAPQTLRVEEVSKDEPVFVPDFPPPTRRYCEEPQYGYNAYNAYLPPRLASTVPSVVPFSTTMSAVSSSDMFCQWGMPSQPAAPDLDYLGYSMPGDLPASEHALMQMGYGGGYDDFLTTYGAADAAAEAQFDMSAYVDGWIDI